MIPILPISIVHNIQYISHRHNYLKIKHLLHEYRKVRRPLFRRTKIQKV